ncbi:MAG: replication-associated recombination protein A, partial [Actinomycetota bacterium]
MTGDLFSAGVEERLARQGPLAARMRPTSLDEIVGQEHLLGAGKPLRVLIEADRLSSVLLWGPPGTGKT